MTDYGFIRVSTGSQDAQTQRRDILRASPNATIVTTDTQAASASKGQQLDALDAVIEKLTAADRIIVTDSSRLDRRENLWEQLSTIMAIRATGATVVSLDPEEDDFAVDPQATIERQRYNAQKSKTVKKQTWRGVQAIIANRAWCGPLPPMWEAVGERYGKQATCTDPSAVRAIYEAVRDGHSLSSIAREHGSYPQSIRNLVRTRANMTGVFECRYTYQGQSYTWQHTASPVVDAELWHAANRVMGERGAIMNNLGGRPVQLATSWISGLLPCPRCDGHLYVSRRKSLRCGGIGKRRISCGVHGIPLAKVTSQLEAIIAREDVDVYRYQRVSGNQGELDELHSELDRLNGIPVTSVPRDQRAGHLDKIAELEDAIAGFQLIPETYEMTPTGETLAGLWRTGDKRQIMKSLQRYISFNVGYGYGEKRMVTGLVWIEGYYPGNTLIELDAETCVRMEVPLRSESLS